MPIKITTMAIEPIHSTRGASRSRQAIWSAPIIAVMLTFLMVGCYTILKHPITSEEGNTQASHQEYYRDRCLDCHADYAEYPYGFFYGTYPDYYFEYPRWGYYYAYPWWWDHYWYQGSDVTADGPDEAGGEGATPSAKAARRGGLIPPYVGGATAVAPTGTHYQVPGSSSTSAKTGTETGTSGASAGSNSEKIRVEKSSDGTQKTDDQAEKKQEKKAGRRGGIDP